MKIRKKKIVPFVAKPDKWNVVTIPATFVPEGDMDQVTGEWHGWVVVEDVEEE